jgi:hypothetical protein
MVRSIVGAINPPSYRVFFQRSVFQGFINRRIFVSKPSARKALLPWIAKFWIAKFGIVAFVAVTAIALITAGPARSGRNPGSAHAVANLGAATSSPSAVTPATRARLQTSYAALPLAFEANEGQTDSQVKYLARGNGYRLYLTSTEAILTIPTGQGTSEVRDMIQNKRRGLAAVKAMLRKRNASRMKQSALAALRMNFLGANSQTQLIAEDPQAGKVNYYLGKDPAKWHSNIPLFGRVNYKDIYPGVSLAFHGAAKQLEFDYVVNPGADPKLIALGFRGAEQIRTTAAGDLILTTAAGPVQMHKPIAYQEKEGIRQPVDASFVIAGRNKVAFMLGAYDRSRELVIDPTVTYSTYFGGGSADYGLGIAVDGSGDAFVTGATDSASLPGFSTTNNLLFDVFVTEINSSGTQVFTTLFGGSQDDFPGGIAVDSQGIYIAGTTDSSNFPTTLGVAQPTFLGGTTSGNNDAFAIKLDLNGNGFPTCSTCWGTYIGGINSDSGLGIAVDSTHNVYVVGETFSTNLGGSAGFGVNHLSNGGALNLNLNNTNDDGYIVKLNPLGTAYSLVSYLGGSNGDLATGVALDASGNIYVSGETLSKDLPTTPGVVQPTCGTDTNCNPNTTGSQDDAFVVAIKADLTGYRYVTYYGGSGVDDGLAIAVDAGGHVSLTGTTLSKDFKTAGTPFQSALLGTQNAFVLELNSSGSAASHATYLGGTGADIGVGIVVDSSNNAYVTGQTNSSDFPTLNPIQTFGGSTDAFVSVLSASPNRLLFSTYLGGGGDENQLGGSIALDTLQNIYVTGDTNSGTGSTAAFPTKNPLVGGGTYGGGTCVSSTGSNVPCPDAFIAAYTPATLPDFALSAAALNPATVTQGGSATSKITVTALNGYSKTVNLTCAVTGGGTPAPKCSLNPTSTTAGGSSTLTVTTTGLNGALVHPSNIFYAMLLPVFGLSLVGIRFSYAGSARKKVWGGLFLGLVITALFFLPACGGSSSGGGGGGGGCTGCTPKGSYTLTVSGTDGTLTHSSPALTLTVN